MERKSAESSLAVVSRRLQAVLDAATEVSIISSDAHGLITVFNKGAERMLGYSAAEMVGKQTPAIIHVAEEIESHGAALEEQLGETIAGFEVFVAHARRGGHEEREWTYVRKDGSRLIVSLVVTALRDELGEITGFLGIAVDVTKRKRAEEEAHRAREIAEAANRAKSQFLANMSHEIRTPMNGIIGMTDLALDTDLTHEQREFLTAVKSSADALLIVINDILDFSKIEAGKLDIDAEPFSLRNSLNEMLRPLVLRAQTKGLDLVCRVAPETPDALVGDLARLRQVLINLVGNALKFTTQGKVVLDVEADQDAGSAQRTLHFAVADTGIGITPEKLQAIFDPFTQADPSTTRTYGGTGLGLTISARLVELLGGKIWVESEVGKGSTFHFTVRCPVGSADHVMTAPTALRQEPPPVLAANVRPLRVLLAEDNLVNQHVGTVLLKKAGHAVTVVDNGRAALAALERGSFDVVLMDVQMPEMDGLVAAAAIREREKTTGKHVPIIALTANAMKGDREECLAAGMDGYISKPLHAEELFKALQQAQSMPSESPSYQREVALRRAGGDEAFLTELMEIFAASAPEALSKMTACLAQGDAAGLRRASHSLRGSAGVFAAQPVMDAAAQLERLAIAEDLSAVRPAFARLTAEVERLLQTMTHQ